MVFQGPPNGRHPCWGQVHCETAPRCCLERQDFRKSVAHAREAAAVWQQLGLKKEDGAIASRKFWARHGQTCECPAFVLSWGGLRHNAWGKFVRLKRVARRDWSWSSWRGCSCSWANSRRAASPGRRGQSSDSGHFAGIRLGVLEFALDGLGVGLFERHGPMIPTRCYCEAWRF